jgi:hypothetical protein
VTRETRLDRMRSAKLERFPTASDDVIDRESFETQKLELVLVEKIGRVFSNPVQ